MDILASLPEDLQHILMDHIHKTCVITIVMMSHVSKLYYRFATAYGLKHKLDRDVDILEASSKGYLEILIWAREHRMEDFIYSGMTKWFRAAENGHLHILKWAYDRNYRMANKCTVHDVSFNWDNFSWRNRFDQCTCGRNICAYAANRGQLDILKWAHSNSIYWDSHTCMEAARNGHFDILKWARSNGCPWNPWTLAEAIQNDYREIFEWALENGCPYDCTIVSVISEKWPEYELPKLLKDLLKFYDSSDSDDSSDSSDSDESND